MKIIERGHVYELAELDHKIGDKPVILRFVNREPGTEHGGTQTQEVLRALIDRTKHCDRCLRWDGNDQIVYHLRMALALHECRALLRKVERDHFPVDLVSLDKDGHLLLTMAGYDPKSALIPPSVDEKKEIYTMAQLLRRGT